MTARASTIDPEASVREPDALVARARAGDRGALEALLHGVAPRVLAAVRSVVGRDATDAEDLAQESLVALVRALPSFRGDCAIASFACGVAVRTALRSRRKWLRRRRKDDERALLADTTPAADDPELDLQRHRRLAAMRSLLRELPVEQAEAFAMRCLLGDSLPEIAAASGANLNTLRSRIRLARTALLRRIHDDATLQELFEVTDVG